MPNEPNADRNALSSRAAARWFCGAALLVAFAGCHTAAPPVASLTPNATASAKFDPSVNVPATTLAVEPVRIALTDSPEPAVDATRPWSELTAIWFYYRSAELTSAERLRVDEVVRYAAEHPAAEIGINRPADASGVEPGNEPVNRQRVTIIHEALVRGGVAPIRIHVGAFEGRPRSLNRHVMVFVRGGG
jgi:hypothetical protein